MSSESTELSIRPAAERRHSTFLPKSRLSTLTSTNVPFVLRKPQSAASECKINVGHRGRLFHNAQSLARHLLTESLLAQPCRFNVA
jgi:hypothetical protein